MEKTARCTSCGSEFTDAELEGVEACPSCGSSGVPCLIADDVEIEINWHELRILGIWADNWARKHCDASNVKTVAAILRRISDQYPDKKPLTLGTELQALANELGTVVEVRHGDDDPIILTPKKSN